MKKRKSSVLLIGPMPKPINGVSICNELIVNKLNHFDIAVIDTANKSFNEKAGSFSLQKVVTGIKPYFKLFKIINKDIIYMTIGQTFYGVLKYYPFFLFSKLLRKEVIIHIHGNYLGKQYTQLNGIKKKFFKHILNKADKGIVLSESLIPNLSPFLAINRIYVLYNFVEENLVNVAIERIQNKDVSQLKIVFLSNLMTEKGILDLLDALQKLTENNIHFTAKIAGNMDANIKDIVTKKINKNPNVNYLGVVRGEEKKELLLNSNVFIFPTYYQMEGQPIAILEAMATGNIVLTTKHAGIPDIFSEKNGFFIEKKAPEDIYNKLRLLQQHISDYKNMMQDNHRYVKENYKESNFLHNLAKIFKDQKCKI
ncbi:MAG TPA: glycosyltransferase [Flavobacteriia bacterium]|nr:glycosyltransferase [Flavobacteriia bacterium]